jgi:hypothetical protein
LRERRKAETAEHASSAPLAAPTHHREVHHGQSAKVNAK